MTKPKLLFFDIETTPIVSLTWGMFKTNVLHVVEPSHMLCYSYQWGLDGEPVVVSQRDFPRFRRDRKSDKDLVNTLADLIDEADVVIAHNGKNFDIKKLQARMFKHGRAKTSHFQWVDTLSIARRHFMHEGNKLDTLAQISGVGKKLPHTGMAMWIGCMENDPDSWDLMEKYNGVDVEILVDVYKKLLEGGWISDHPNMSVISGAMRGCPKCGDTEARMYPKKYRYYATRAVVQSQCGSCESYSTRRHDGSKKGPMYSN